MKKNPGPTPKVASKQKTPASPAGGAALPRITNILAPVDFSKAGRPALLHAKALALLTGAKVCLLHVREIVYTGADFALPAVQDVAQVRERIERELGALQMGLFKGVRTDFEVRDGLPYREIVDVAKARRCNLVVMATHGHTGLAHVLMGSTAERVVRYASCPVLVVRSLRA